MAVDPCDSRRRIWQTIRSGFSALSLPRCTSWPTRNVTAAAGDETAERGRSTVGKSRFSTELVITWLASPENHSCHDIVGLGLSHPLARHLFHTGPSPATSPRAGTSRPP